MKGMWKGRRALSLLLALVLTLSLLPPYALPVYSNENVTADQQPIVTDPGSYSDLIGCNAELNLTNWVYIVVSDDPTVLMEDGQELVATDVFEPVVLVIEDCHWVEETCSLWLKVEAADGYTLPAKLQKYPWVFQNYTDVYEEDDWQTFSPDALLISAPAYTEPASIVSDEGITVSSDNALFTDLIVTETQAPTAYYISNAVAYNMTPRTNEGKYTGHADVSIPIPEGWDSEKVFGFVVEDDGTVTALLGTVTQFGTFQFTVPHFSEVGLLEATAVEDVKNVTITFGRVRSENIISLPGKVDTAGRYVSGDGAVQYVINHVVADDTTTTYISFMGLDVTPGTEIILGDVSVVVIVKEAENEVAELLSSVPANSGNYADHPNYVQLDPLYDLTISGDFTIEYIVDSGNDCVSLVDGLVTAVEGTAGEAVITATVKHPASQNTVGTVTYNVTVINQTVSAVKRIYVPQGGQVKILDFTGIIKDDIMNEDIATVEAADADSDGVADDLLITGVASSGETSVIVGDVMLHIYAEPANPMKDVQTYILFQINANQNCTIYYAINGGTLHKCDSKQTGTICLIGLDNDQAQLFPDGFNIMFFGLPNDGYITAKIVAPGTDGQFYCLSNGARYDGSESDAWPLNDNNAQDTSSGAKTDSLNKKHGLYWSLVEGNMTVAQMRDLFTRALALGCDSVTTFTKNNGDSAEYNLSFYGEALPSFEKTISQIKKVDGTILSFTEDSPYTTDVILEVGDEVTYQFEITINSENISYWFDLADTSIGYTYSTGNSETGEKSNLVLTQTYTIGMTNGEMDPNKIKLYAEGKFTNEASLSYSYKSSVASGKTETVATSSVTCRISSIVTWMDNYGNIWDVQKVEQGSTVSTSVTPTMNAYTFDDWDYNVAGITMNNGQYVVDYSADSITILGTFVPTPYTMTYVLNDGSLPDGVANPATYTIESLITLPAPVKPGHRFDCWKVTSAEGVWTEGAAYPAETVMVNRYGNVTLEACWTRVTTTLTIGVAGCEDIDANQTFLFQITGEDGVDMVVTVHGNSTVTIDGLTENGVYTVTQLEDWSWRYTATGWSYGDGNLTGTGGNAPITVSNDGTITFTNQRHNHQWLDGDSWLDNLFVAD